MVASKPQTHYSPFPWSSTYDGPCKVTPCPTYLPPMKVPSIDHTQHYLISCRTYHHLLSLTTPRIFGTKRC
ncbi:hypothetical protein FPOAC1_001794 [Fusarium poae]|uniref:hypothetical protein n=1 Tax=Fusarium poae TaxID=36050 RepID=UPI001CE744C8|nr:hypothetical protein FPOAC1_001794 [Fusarium poae]KAG8675800.1 hypothetical protein FPOAC1_001794 [Fusarium poae]